MWIALEKLCQDPEFQPRTSNRLGDIRDQSLITLALLDAHIWAWIEGVQKVGQD